VPESWNGLGKIILLKLGRDTKKIGQDTKCQTVPDLQAWCHDHGL
jgi:hypothetical protein